MRTSNGALYTVVLWMIPVIAGVLVGLQGCSSTDSRPDRSAQEQSDGAGTTVPITLSERRFVEPVIYRLTPTSMES